MLSGLMLLLFKRCIWGGLCTSRLKRPRRWCSCFTLRQDSRRFFLRLGVCTVYCAILRSIWRLLLSRFSRMLCSLRCGRASGAACCCNYYWFVCCFFDSLIPTMLRPAWHARRSRQKCYFLLWLFRAGTWRRLNTCFGKPQRLSFRGNDKGASSFVVGV